MNRKTSRMIAAVMLAAAVVFLIFAFTHPECSFPWSNKVTYTLYGIYMAVMVILFIAPFKKEG